MLRFYYDTIIVNNIIHGTKINKADYSISKDFEIPVDQCPPYQAYCEAYDNWVKTNPDEDIPEPEQPEILDMGDYVIRDYEEKNIKRPVRYSIQLDDGSSFGAAVIKGARERGIDIIITDSTTKRSTTTTTRKRWTDTDKINTLVNSGKTLAEAVEIIKQEKIKSATNNHKNDPDKLNKALTAIEEQASKNFGFGGIAKLDKPADSN